MRTFRDAALAVAAGIVMLALLEVGLRVAGAKFEASLYEPHPRMYAVWRSNAEGWTVKEGESYVRINSAGMRDRERTIAKTPGTIRIAFLGDSMVAGLQVPLERTMTQVLERRLTHALKATGRTVEVLNFAVGGYALSQMYLALDERVWSFQPDVVMVGLSGLTVPNSYRKTKSLGDVPLYVLDGESLVADPANRPPSGTGAESLRWHKILGDLHNEVRILQLVRTAQQSNWWNALVWTKTVQTAPPASRPAEFMRVWSYRPPQTLELATAWDITEAILERMIITAREHGAEFWIVQIGNDIEEDPRDDEREQFLQVNQLAGFEYAGDRYARFAVEHGVSFFRLSPHMLEYSRTMHLPLRGFFNTRPYEGHWNDDGNAVAASIIGAQLLRRSPKLAEGTRSAVEN